MKTITKWCGVCVFAALTAAPVLAQEEKPVGHPKFYRLDFAVKEVEGGKTVNSRSYSMEISQEPRGSSIRAGSRIPILASGGGYSYNEVGVNLDCKLYSDNGGEISVNVAADISSLESTTSPVVIRNTKWSATVLIPLRKATTIFSSDDPGSKRQFQLDLTATPIQ